MTGQTNSEMLTDLLSVVRENRKEREKMLSILRLDPTRRKIAINILVTEMRRANAPADFIQAWDALQDDALAEQARTIIEDSSFDASPDPKTIAVIFGFLIFLVVVVLAVALHLKK